LTSAAHDFVTWAASPAAICSTRNGPASPPFRSASAWSVSGAFQIEVLSSGQSVCMVGFVAAASIPHPAGRSAGASSFAANPVALGAVEGAVPMAFGAVAEGCAEPAAPGELAAADDE